MVVESILAWFMSIFQFAISLLPANGHLFDGVKEISFTFIKYIGAVNGYIPVVEIGKVFVMMVAVQASMLTIRIIMGTYNYVTKVIP